MGKHYYITIGLIILITIGVLLLQHTTKYKLKLVDKFEIINISRNTNHAYVDGFAVSFALSDSYIYVLDTSDTTNTISKCYSYSGSQTLDFSFPKERGYGEVLNEDVFYYLPSSNKLAYNYWNKRIFDIYSLKGEPIERLKMKLKMKGSLVDMCETNSTRYYVTNSYPKSNKAPIAYLFQEKPEDHVTIIDSFLTESYWKRACMTSKQFQVDNFDNKKMASLKVYDKYYMVKIFVNNISKDLRIRRYIRIFPWQFQDSPYKFNLGKNYVIIGSWKKDMKYPLLERIYDFKGHYIGRLNFKDDPKNELVDIVGDRLVAFNPATSVISIYVIKVK